jgi:MraZ protein
MPVQNRRSVLKEGLEHMFLGKFAHTFDEKGRIAIPTRFRDLLEDGAYLTQGFDKNLIVWCAKDFEQIYTQVNSLSFTDPNTRLLKRLIFANATRVDIDKVGRVLIPQFLREAANLNSSNAIIVGAGNNFEIWSPEEWEKQDAMLQDSDTNAQRFSTLDLSVK